MTVFLKTTTSIGLIMMMGLPAPSFAQDACGNGSFPCTLEDGTVVQTVEALDAEMVRRAEAPAQGGEATEDAPDTQAETAEAVKDAEAAAAKTVEDAEAAAAEADVDAQAAEEAVAAEAEANAQAAEEAAAAQEQADAQAAEEAAAEAQADADAKAAEEAAAEAQADADAQAAEEAAAAQEQAEADARAAEEAEAEAQADADADAQAGEKAAAAQAEADANAAEEAEAAEQERAAAQAEQSDAERAAAAEQQAIADQARAERQAERARREAESLAAAAQEEGSGEIVSETVTEETARSSSEEFTAQAEAEEKDDGLSKFEKALLFGLGAVAVGKILDNGDEVKSTSGDRVVVEREGELRVLKNDDALLRRPGNDIQTETFNDGSTRTIVTKPDSTRIVTIRSADGRVLRRLRVLPDGQEFTLFDDTQAERQIVVSELPRSIAESRKAGVAGEDELRAALEAEAAANSGAAFSLRQVRDIRQVRALAPEIELDAVRFASGSAAIQPEQARSLARIGNTLRDLIEADPRTVLLVEGHTDAVGDASYNLALSDRRAETVALALTEYFDVPVENMIVQGYGESQLKVETLAAEQANRRSVVRNITQLLR